MRILAVVFALLSVPAFAADYSPWSAQAGERFAQILPGKNECTGEGFPGCPGCGAVCPSRGFAAVCKDGAPATKTSPCQKPSCSCEPR